MKTVLASGVLVRQDDKSQSEYHIRRLEANDFKEVCRLQQLVLDSLEDKDCFLGRPHGIVWECLQDRGSAIGIYVRENLIAYRMLYYPGSFNLGDLAGLPSTEWSKVAHLEVEAVHPMYRGNGLQQLMGAPLLALAGDMRGKRYLCSVVSPKNYPSIKDKLALGLSIVNLITLPGGSWRFVFCQDRLRKVDIDLNSVIKVAAEEREIQLELLAQGYIGFCIEKSQNGFKICFGTQRAV